MLARKEKNEQKIRAQNTEKTFGHGKTNNKRDMCLRKFDEIF